MDCWSCLLPRLLQIHNLWHFALTQAALFMLLKDSFIFLSPKIYLPLHPPYTHTHKSYSYIYIYITELSSLCKLIENLKWDKVSGNYLAVRGEGPKLHKLSAFWNMFNRIVYLKQCSSVILTSRLYQLFPNCSWDKGELIKHSLTLFSEARFFGKKKRLLNITNLTSIASFLASSLLGKINCASRLNYIHPIWDITIWKWKAVRLQTENGWQH